jgi:hypothetical protein
MHIAKDAVRGEPAADTAGERDFLLSVFRTAAARARLTVNALETIGTALRNRQINCQGAIAWSKDEGILDHLVLAPPSQGGGK